MSHDIKSAERPEPDRILTVIADYAGEFRHQEQGGVRNRPILPDGYIGLRLPSPQVPGMHPLMGPVVPGATLSNGARVPGTAYELDPINAAFNIGAMIRWLDFNDTWLAASGAIPPINLGAILALADYLSRPESA